MAWLTKEPMIVVQVEPRQGRIALTEHDVATVVCRPIIGDLHGRHLGLAFALRLPSIATMRIGVQMERGGMEATAGVASHTSGKYSRGSVPPPPFHDPWNGCPAYSSLLNGFALLLFSVPVVRRLHPFIRQALAVIPARKRALAAFLAVGHQVVEIQHLAGAAVVPLVLGVIAEIFIRHDDLVSELRAVGEFVDGVGYGIGHR